MKICTIGCLAGKLVDKMKKIYIVVNGEKNTASDSISSINRKNNTNIKKIRNGRISEIHSRDEIIDKLAEMEWLRKRECLRDRAYMECVYDIMNSKPFQKMHDYIQHGTTTTLEHCISVSYMSYKISRVYGLDYVSAARGALLHDLFLYDWHTHRQETGNHFHGFTHPVVALHNAMKYYHLNETEKDIIKKHMWPLTVIPPKTMEGYVVMYADKYCSLMETGQTLKRKFRLFLT